MHRPIVATLAVLAALCFAATAIAQDVITVGTVTANGPNVDVPVFIRDASGTPLGMDQPPTSRIQAFSIRVTYSPASAVSSVSFTRAGITTGLTPAFETAPASPGAITLLASFQQSTNPIPFTLNGAGPGDLVAHLVFTLAPSASDIAISIDETTTQLNDEGGNAATKETTNNGRLGLVNGAIQLPQPSLRLFPVDQVVDVGGAVTLNVDTVTQVFSNTTVSLSTSDPLVAAVPASVVVAAGTRLASVTVSGLSAGSATITASLPPSAGGLSAKANVNVVTPTNCTAPPVPQISAPSTAIAGSTYAVTWAAVSGASEYIIDEATDAAFATASARTVTATSASYSHPAGDVRYHYRVRARNRTSPCDVMSANSAAASVLVTTVVAPATRMLPVAGSTAGTAGSFFKTSLQLYNPKSAAISGKLVFHTQGASGSAGDPSLAYSIQPGRTLAFSDLLPAMGIAAGLGSIDLIADATSPLPLALARVFSDAGAAGTTGFAFESMSADDALKQGHTGALLAPVDMQKFRLNIGVRALDGGAAMTVTVRSRDGVLLKTVQKTFAATFFSQVGSAAFLDGFALTGGETISIEVTAGAAFLYGATTDNATNDPSVQFARRIE